MTTTFARARSDEQRAERRAVILATAATMLEGSRVAELSLNELARRVGLAKSNVLRYFESREAVLLELLDSEYGQWLDAVEAELAASDVREPVEKMAEVVSRTIAERPVLSELMASASTVLEHNVSAEVAAAYKRAALAKAERLVGIAAVELGELDGPSAVAVAGVVNLAIGGAWGMCRPSPGMVAAYARYPELEAFRLDYRVTVRELTATMLTGLLHRPASAAP